MEIANTSLASDLRECAILLDIDGTILDIAPAPQEVWVPPALRHTLGRLQELTGGAVALVSGRPLDDIDLIFAPLQLAAIGGHGAEMRPVPGTVPQTRVGSLSAELKRKLATITELGRGILVEDKGYSLALHYRLAADAGAALVCIESLLQGIEPALRRFGGKCVVNVLAEGLPDKGDALVALLRRSKAVAAVFVGDDVNDEAVFMRAEPPSLTIRIGGDDTLSQAMYFLDSEAQLALVLQRMLALRAPP